MVYKTLNTSAYEYLRDGILSGRIEPGRFYSENQISKEIGISRTPIRAALQQLQQSKLIEIVPNKGFTVHTMTFRDVSETYQIRAAIEGFAARKLAGDKSAEKKRELKKLEALCAKQKTMLEKPFDIDRFTGADEEFHETLVDYLGNDTLSDFYYNQMNKIYIICVNTFQVPERPVLAIKEHEAILAAIGSGNCDAAQNAVNYHMEKIMEMMDSIINKTKKTDMELIHK